MADEEYVHYRGGNSGIHQTSICGLILAPELLTFDWRGVTCKTCMKHRPVQK